jgi:[acyl-carrier-protein] S-malonyltransferase
MDEGFTRFIELGPGNALTGFMRRIDSEAQVLNVADSENLKKTVAALTE